MALRDEFAVVVLESRLVVFPSDMSNSRCCQSHNSACRRQKSARSLAPSMVVGHWYARTPLTNVGPRLGNAARISSSTCVVINLRCAKTEIEAHRPVARPEQVMRPPQWPHLHGFGS